MGDTVTIPLVGALVGLIGLLVAVLNIREQPRVKVALLISIALIFLFFFWYVSPAAKINVLLRDRKKMFEDKVKSDSSIRDEAKEIEDAQRRKEKALRDEEVFETERRAKEAERARDIAAQATLDEQQHSMRLQENLKMSASQDLQNSISGTWKCAFGSTLEFRPDGTGTGVMGIGITYRIVGSTQVQITGLFGHGSTTTNELSLDTPVQTIKGTYFDCSRPKQ